MMKELKGILGPLLEENPAYKEKLKEFEVYEAWTKAVGEAIARHCWPIKFTKEGMLIVGSSSSSWIHQLKYMELQILNNLEKKLGDRIVKKLRFQIAVYSEEDRKS